MARFVEMTVRAEANNILQARICLLKITQLPDAIETSEQGIAEIAQTGRLVGVAIRGEVNCVPVSRNCLLAVARGNEIDAITLHRDLLDLKDSRNPSMK